MVAWAKESQIPDNIWLEGARSSQILMLGPNSIRVFVEMSIIYLEKQACFLL